MEAQDNSNKSIHVGFTITHEEFLTSANKFIEKSNQLYDGWERNEFKGVTYLKLLKHRMVKSHLIHSEKGDKDISSLPTVECTSSVEDSKLSDLTNISLEYNILYSVSYRVPVLYLRGYDSFGCGLRLDDLIKSGLFSRSTQDNDKLDDEKLVKHHSRDRDEKHHIPTNFVRSDTFSQVSHPLNFQPFYQLHPCHTSEWMKMMCSVKRDKEGSRMQLSVENYIIVWLSFVASFIGLSLDNKYMLP